MFVCVIDSLLHHELYEYIVYLFVCVIVILLHEDLYDHISVCLYVCLCDCLSLRVCSLVTARMQSTKFTQSTGVDHRSGYTLWTLFANLVNKYCNSVSRSCQGQFLLIGILTCPCFTGFGLSEMVGSYSFVGKSHFQNVYICVLITQFVITND